jgi:hypothetical protein
MAKSMRNAVKEAAKVSNERESLIKAALNNGHTTRSAIVKSTGLDKNVVSSMLSNNKELRAAWILKKRNLVSIALDNIEDIVNNPDHKDHGTMSKWIVSNLDSDVGELLFPHNDIEMTIPGSNPNEGDSGVVIKFSKSKNIEE